MQKSIWIIWLQLSYGKIVWGKLYKRMRKHDDGKKSSFCPAKKHCDAPAEDIEPCSLLLGQPWASSSKGFEGFTHMFGAWVDVFLHHGWNGFEKERIRKRVWNLVWWCDCEEVYAL